MKRIILSLACASFSIWTTSVSAGPQMPTASVNVVNTPSVTVNGTPSVSVTNSASNPVNVAVVRSSGHQAVNVWIPYKVPNTTYYSNTKVYENTGTVPVIFTSLTVYRRFSYCTTPRPYEGTFYIYDPQASSSQGFAVVGGLQQYPSHGGACTYSWIVPTPVVVAPGQALWGGLRLDEVPADDFPYEVAVSGYTLE